MSENPISFFGRVEKPVSDQELLEWVARVGGAAPEQIAALIASTSPFNLPFETYNSIQERLNKLVGSNHLIRHRLFCNMSALQGMHRHLFRLTQRGERSAPHLNGWRRRVVIAIHKEGKAAHEGWVTEDLIWSEALQGYSHRRNVRARLRKLVAEGGLETKETKPKNEIQLLTLSPSGEDFIKESYIKEGDSFSNFTRTPRVDHAIHHLLSVEATIVLLNATNGTLLQLKGDEDLRSESRRGRSLAKGEKDVKLPDGLLIYKEEGGAVREVELEILVSKYSDEQILEKYEEFDPSKVLFFAPTVALRERTKALTGFAPLLLGTPL